MDRIDQVEEIGTWKKPDKPVFQDISPVEGEENGRSEARLLEAILSIAASLNHEINNPLTSVLGNTQLLMNSEFAQNVEIRKKLKAIEYNATKIRRIIIKLQSIAAPAFFSYAGGEKLIDLSASKYKEWIGEED